MRRAVEGDEAEPLFGEGELGERRVVQRPTEIEHLRIVEVEGATDGGGDGAVRACSIPDSLNRS